MSPNCLYENAKDNYRNSFCLTAFRCPQCGSTSISAHASGETAHRSGQVSKCVKCRDHASTDTGIASYTKGPGKGIANISGSSVGVAFDKCDGEVFCEPNLPNSNSG